MERKILEGFIQQLYRELRTIDGIIADLENFQSLQSGQRRRGRPPKLLSRDRPPKPIRPAGSRRR